MQQPLRKAMLVIMALACMAFTSVSAWAEPSADSGVSSDAGAAIGNGQQESAEHDAEPPVDLQQQIAGFVDKLAKQPGFELWSQARWDSYPLGPGIRGWVVILRKDGKECGYLIVNAAPDGTYKLGEYGTGSNPLFGVDALSQSLQSLKLGVGMDRKVNSTKVKRLYTDPWHSVWSVNGQSETKLLDSATGDTLPIRWDDVKGEFASPGQTVDSGAGINDRILQTLQTSAFDPYERLNWLFNDPMPSPSSTEISSLVASPDSERLTFVSQPFNGQAIYAYAVSGAQEWETAGLFLRLSANGEDRYVPLSQMIELGHFYH
jgi:hypothetical protein